MMQFENWSMEPPLNSMCGENGLLCDKLHEIENVKKILDNFLNMFKLSGFMPKKNRAIVYRLYERWRTRAHVT